MRMRREGKYGSCVAVHLRTNEFRHFSHQSKLNCATSITRELFREAARVFDEMWDRKTPLRQLGVQITELWISPTSSTTCSPGCPRSSTNGKCGWTKPWMPSGTASGRTSSAGQNSPMIPRDTWPAAWTGPDGQASPSPCRRRSPKIGWCGEEIKENREFCCTAAILP